MKSCMYANTMLAALIIFSSFPGPATLNLTLTAGDDGVVWSPQVPDRFPVQLYEMEYRGGQCDPESVRSENFPASNVSTSYTDLGLEMGGSYFVRMRSVNVLSAGAWSASAEINTPRNGERINNCCFYKT